MEKMKACKVCKVEKPTTDEYFPNKPSMVHGLGNTCKACIDEKRIANKAIRNAKLRAKTEAKRDKRMAMEEIAKKEESKLLYKKYKAGEITLDKRTADKRFKGMEGYKQQIKHRTPKED